MIKASAMHRLKIKLIFAKTVKKMSGILKNLYFSVFFFTVLGDLQKQVTHVRISGQNTLINSLIFSTQLARGDLYIEV